MRGPGYKVDVEFTGSLADLWRAIDRLPPQFHTTLVQWTIVGNEVFKKPGRQKGRVPLPRFKYDPP